ncbi:C4-dicarboxylate ABC transporter permease [Thalassospira profundimaris]|uniref:TRAP transporter large permease protein n=1 Tax=Thalassospira profundimaris TaxID=502049 RepID=A0A367XF19_9PROT|nr:TRAP transporter large permease [Thalassospira profundimaris]RCK52254.1 C4-dicarboxylate ABC transporter permease [Thalassospira profundimaris]
MDLGTTIIIVMLGLLLLGFPMMVPLAAASVIAFAFFMPIPHQIIIQQMVSGISPVALIAVPMFIFAADIVTKGRTASRLIDLAMTFVGHIRGGLAVTTALGCTLFGAVSGSTQATVVAMGGPLRPKMLEAGYKDSFTMALIINASDIAFLIPPSIGMIVFGVVGKVSIGELFIAGIGPGVLILLLFSAYSVWYAKHHDIPTIPRRTWLERGKAVINAGPAIMFPVLIVGGIYLGWVSPTEVAAVSVIYAIILEVLIFRSVKWHELLEIARSTGLITAVVFILVGAGTTFSFVISFAQIPQAVIGALALDSAGPYTILFAISIAFFIGCMFVDPIVVILVLTPIFMPLVNNAGIDPILVGTLVTLQVAIGSATPPFGCDIFTAIAIFRRPYAEVIKGTPPFICMLLLVAVLLIFFPQIATFLPETAFR